MEDVVNVFAIGTRKPELYHLYYTLLKVPNWAPLHTHGFLLPGPHLPLLEPPRNSPDTLRSHHLRQPAKHWPSVRRRRPEPGAGAARPRHSFRRCRRHFCSQQVRRANLGLRWWWLYRIGLCLCTSPFRKQVSGMVSVYGWLELAKKSLCNLT